MSEDCKNCGKYLLDYYSKELRNAQFFNKPTPKLEKCPFCGYEFKDKKIDVNPSIDNIDLENIKSLNIDSEEEQQDEDFDEFEDKFEDEDYVRSIAGLPPRYPSSKKIVDKTKTELFRKYLFTPLFYFILIFYFAFSILRFLIKLPFVILRPYLHTWNLVIFFILVIGTGLASEISLIADKAESNNDMNKKLYENNSLDPSDSREESFSKYALLLINEDRSKKNLPPLILGNNRAAQIHAEDATKHGYVSHWMMNGEKPYQVYSRLGGNSYISENIAGDGWWDGEWEKQNCDSFSINCTLPIIEETIKDAQFDFMYNDLICCNNGHRDNILNPAHRKVNIGISIDKDLRFVSYVQHFEGGHFIAINKPNLSDNILDFRIQNITKEYNFSDTPILIYFDPLPSYLGTEKGNHPQKFNEYCIGGGYSLESCKTEKYLFAQILQPLSGNEFYEDLEPNHIIANKWLQSKDFLDVSVDFSQFNDIRNVKKIPPGVYTVIIFGDHIGFGRSDVLIELSVIQE